MYIGVPARCGDWVPAVGTGLPTSCAKLVLAVWTGVPAHCIDWGVSVRVGLVETSPHLGCSLHVLLCTALMFSSSNFNRSRSLNQIIFLAELKMCFFDAKKKCS